VVEHRRRRTSPTPGQKEHGNDHLGRGHTEYQVGNGFPS
jgi:hypothetical protein